MTKKDIDNIISIICPNDEDYEKPIISPAYLKKELEVLALEQEPCEDDISRQAVIEAFQMFREYEANRTNAEWVDRIETVVKKLPPVNPQPKIGRWIRWYEQKEHDGCTEYIPHCKCSECGKEYNPHSSQFIKYCPNCGAKMIEQETKINEDISKGFEEFTRMMFKQGQGRK